MNKKDLLDHIEHEKVVDKNKLRKMYDRKFGLSAIRGNATIVLGEYDDINYTNFYKDKIDIIRKMDIVVTPTEVLHKHTSISLNVDSDYTFKMQDTGEVIEMKDLIKDEDKYILKTDLLELGDFIRFKRIFPAMTFEGTAIVSYVETYKIEMLVFGNNDKYRYIDIWAHEIFNDDQEFEFEILNKHEYVTSNGEPKMFGEYEYELDEEAKDDDEVVKEDVEE